MIEDVFAFLHENFEQVVVEIRQFQRAFGLRVFRDRRRFGAGQAAFAHDRCGGGRLFAGRAFEFDRFHNFRFGIGDCVGEFKRCVFGCDLLQRLELHGRN
ncbi:MAG: hypothetical protein ACREPX_03585, partial [Rhodanobacteraceae bacterium]